SRSAPVTPTSESNYQSSNSFSTLISSLKNDGTNGDSVTEMVDQYSSNIRRKYVKDVQGGLGDKISYGIESLGKPFSLSLNRDKRKDSEKDGDKQNTPKNSGKFIGIFGPKNEEPEKPNGGNTENENGKNINIDKEDKKPETVTDSEKILNGKQDSSEKEAPKKKEEIATSPSSTF